MGKVLCCKFSGTTSVADMFFVTLLFCQDRMFKLKDSYQCSVLVAKALDFESKSSYVLNITASNVSFASVLQYLQSVLCTLQFCSDLVS